MSHIRLYASHLFPKKSVVSVNSQMIGIKSKVNKDYTIQFQC